MPADVYVAGPVVDGLDDAKAGLYSALAAEVEGLGLSVALPVRDRALDGLKPRDFARAVSKRIEEAQVVVTVLSRGDQSVPVEATMASNLGKTQTSGLVD